MDEAIVKLDVDEAIVKLFSPVSSLNFYNTCMKYWMVLSHFTDGGGKRFREVKQFAWGQADVRGLLLFSP